MALFAVAGLMRYRVAYSVVEVSRSPSERSPERIRGADLLCDLEVDRG